MRIFSVVVFGMWVSCLSAQAQVPNAASAINGEWCSSTGSRVIYKIEANGTGTSEIFTPPNGVSTRQNVVEFQKLSESNFKIKRDMPWQPGSYIETTFERTNRGLRTIDNRIPGGAVIVANGRETFGEKRELPAFSRCGNVEATTNTKRPQSNFTDSNYVNVLESRFNVSCFKSMNKPLDISFLAVAKPEYLRALADEQELLRLARLLLRDSENQCKTERFATEQYTFHFSIGNGDKFSGVSGENGKIITVTNGIAKTFREQDALQERQTQAAQEGLRQQQMQVQVLASAKSKVASDLGIQIWLTPSQLSSNPFINKGRIVGTLVSFDHMISESEAIFIGGNGIYVSDVPSTLFQGGESVVLAGRVTGNKSVKTPMGGEVIVPALQYFGVFNCRQNTCQGF